VVIERGIEQRKLAQAGYRGARDERQVGKAETVSRLELRLVALEHAGYFGHVHAMDGGDVRRSALGHQHVLGDFGAHRAHRLDARLGLSGGRQRGHGGRGGGNGGGNSGRERSGGGGGGRLLRGGVGFHVLLGNPAAGAGALHLRQIEIELARHLAHQRRERTGGLGSGGRFHLLGRWGRGRSGRLGRSRRRFGGSGGSGLSRRRFRGLGRRRFRGPWRAGFRGLGRRGFPGG